MAEYDQYYGDERKPTPHFGLIAWMIVILGIISLVFVLLDWQHVTFDTIVIALQLAIGLGAAAMMGEDVRGALTTTEGQAEVLIWGFIGGSALMALSQFLYVAYNLIAFATIGTAGNVVLAPIVETLIWDYVLFGTFWYIGDAIGVIKWLRFLVTAIPSAAIFAFWHYWAHNGLPILPMLILFSGSLMLKAIYAKTDDAGTPMLAHLFNNALAIMATIAVWVGLFWWVLAIPIFFIIMYLICSRGGTLK